MDVVLSDPAYSDLLHVHADLAAKSPQAADKAIRYFARRVDELSRFPLIGRRRDELGAGLRGLLIGNWIAFYRVDAARIVIVRIIDARMDIDEDYFK